MNETRLQYIFRRPKFPLLGNIEGFFIGAKTEAALLKMLQHTPLKEDGHYDILDSTGEGWRFDVKLMVISPLTLKKRWAKKEIIALFNERENKEVGQGKLYSEKSLSSKRLDRIISDLVALAGNHEINK